MNEWAAELYAHAVAIQGEASARYDEPGDAMADQGYHAVSFESLCAHEGL